MSNLNTSSNIEDIILKRKISIALIVFIGVISLWASTQYFAYLVQYHSILGNAIYITADDYKIYQPFSIISWYLQYYDYAPDNFLSALSLIFYVWLPFIPVLWYYNQRPKMYSIHGTAEWMTTTEDLKAAKLLPTSNSNAVFLGVTGKGEYLRHEGPEHLIAVAPTRSGKGVSLIIPTLLSWKGSTVTIDIKGENYGITAGYRKNVLNQKILHFNPADASGLSCRFNPLAEIRIGTYHEMQDAQNIAQLLMDPDGKSKDDHWTQAGLGFVVGAILCTCYKEKLRGRSGTLSSLINLINPPGRPYTLVVLEEMLQGVHTKDKDLFSKIYGVSETLTHPKIAQAASELLSKPDKERGSVHSTVVVKLSLYRDPIIEANTSVSDFSISDLMNYKTPVNLYLVIPPSEILRLMPLTRIIVSLITTRLVGTMEYKNGEKVGGHKHKLLLMLDEFPAMGKLESMEKALAFVAGYGIRVFIIAQSTKQIDGIYGKSNAIIDNCHIKVFFAPNDPDTPQIVSRLLGKRTEKIVTESWKGFKYLSEKNYSASYHGRELLTPDEINRMPYNKQLIFVTGHKPLYTNKNFYYEDENFIRRYKKNPAPDHSDVLYSDKGDE